jgi:uncharacterized protein (DUF1015 family)
MAKIIPFKGLRPRKDLASQVATLPYDVCSVEEARKYKDNPYHFYHVTRSEIDLSDTVDVHSPEVYERAAENLSEMIEKGVLVQDNEPCYYIYRLIMNGREQTVLFADHLLTITIKGSLRNMNLPVRKKNWTESIISKLPGLKPVSFFLLIIM